jgi:hypothetical protein
MSLSMTPASLNAVYGRRVNPGFAVFATIRPRAM